MGNDYNDTLYGGFGDDFLEGGSDKDVVLGGFGDDTLAADYNDKLISGGEGTDKLVLLDDIAHEHTSDYKIDLERNELSYLETIYYDDGRLNGQLTIKTEIKIEDVIGSSLSETIIGNDRNYLDDGGNDMIYGGAGEDLLSRSRK